MTFFCISYVALFYLIKTNAASLDPVPPQLLEIVSRQVKTLLTDVNKKDATERKLLSQFDDGNKKDTAPVLVKKLKNQTFEELDLVRTKQDSEDIDTAQNPGNPPYSEAKALQLLKTLWELPKEKFIVPDAPEFEPDPFDDKIFNVQTTTVKPENPLDETPEKKTMLLFMKKNDVSYCYGSTIGLFDMIIKKPDDLLDLLVIAFENTISRMAKADALKCLDYLLTRRLQSFALVSRFTPVSIIKGYAERISLALESKNANAMYPHVRELLLKYDKFFNDEEGDELLDSVVMLQNYSKNVENYAENAAPLARTFIDAVLAPTKRLCGSYQLRTFIAEINQAYMAHFPDAARTIDALMNLNRSSDLPLRSPFEQSMSMFNKDSMSQFTEIVHAFILKYQELFIEFAKEHITSKEHQDYHLRPNKNDKSGHTSNQNNSLRRSRRRHRNRKFNKQTTQKPSTQYNMNSTTHR